MITFLLAAILFVLLVGFASFRKGLLWALRGDMGDYYIVDQRRNWIVTQARRPPRSWGANSPVLRAWVVFQLRRMLGLRGNGLTTASRIGVPVNLFDAMHVVLRKPG
jgi:hypothetical protein